MQPFTVLLKHGGDGPPHIHHVMAADPVAAYLEAVSDREMIEALTYDIGLGRKLSMDEAAFEWPLLLVAEGHIEMEPVLTAEDLHRLISERPELELEAS